MAKSKDNIQEKDTKTKPKKTKKVETLEPKVSQADEPLDSIKVDVEIDLRNDLKQPCVYIRRKRSI